MGIYTIETAHCAVEVLEAHTAGTRVGITRKGEPLVVVYADDDGSTVVFHAKCVRVEEVVAAPTLLV